MDDLDHVEYRPNENAQRVRAHYVRDLHFVGNDGVFELVQLKRTATGALYMETECYVEIPTWAIRPGIALTLKKLGTMLAAPIAETVSRVFRRAH